MKCGMEEWVNRVEEEGEGEESNAGVLHESEWEGGKGVEEVVEAGLDGGK
jgi:hypothetical protein